MNKSALAGILIGSATLLFAPATLADPPRWSAAQGVERDDHWRDYRDEKKRYLKGNYRKHEQRKRYRHRYHQQQRKYLYERPARGPVFVLRPGSRWYTHAYVGQRLPRDFYRYRYHLPAHAKVRRLHSGITELIIADQIIRILDATQTIINVRR